MADPVKALVPAERVARVRAQHIDVASARLAIPLSTKSCSITPWRTPDWQASAGPAAAAAPYSANAMRPR